MVVLFLLGTLLLALLRPVLGDADFASVRTKLSKDYSSKGLDPKEKYFHESNFHYHYDGRFADHTLPDDKRLPYLVEMTQSYLSTMHDIGAETWIMHGTLLGWWWNQKIMPWDSDLDVQVSEATMHFLASYYNMTEHTFTFPDHPEGRTYLLEVNPHYVVGSTSDTLNVIDARWIDTASGLFIDITSVREDHEARRRGHVGALMCKDRHRYNERQIFPLRESYFEGIPVNIPYEYIYLLEEEYGQTSLTNTHFNEHKFNSETNMWESD